MSATLNPRSTSKPPTTAARPPRRARVWALGAGGLALLVLLAVGMRLDPRELPSALIGRPWPALALPRLDDPGQSEDASAWSGRARVVNLWASWCGTCREEHPALMALAGTLRKQGRADQLIGLNYKDPTEAARGWLARLGDPYSRTLVDAEGRMAIELGVYGAPETFVVDAGGRIVWKHAGALTPELIAQEVLPRLADPGEVATTAPGGRP